jgi:16S rRNA (cytosine967-C5)-methyltransferase
MQRNIIDKSIYFIKKNGFLVYSTCSILKSENENQVEYIKKKYKDLVVVDSKLHFPESNEMDGFFYCVFQNKSS